jgi:kexin
MRQPTTTTPHLMLLTLALLLPFTPSTLALRPIPRTYSTHHYYSLETRPGVTESQARDWARELGVEWVEKVGELDGVWLVRDERPRVDKRSDEEANRTDHPVLARWDEMRKDGGIRKRTEGSSTTTTATIHTSQIKRIDHLPLRKRTKRSTSSSSPPPFHPLHLTQLNPTSSSFSSRQESNPNPYPTPNLTELNYAQTQLNLQDPLLPDQWHIINTLLPDVELNVTKVWGEGVRGKGVKVAIIDDGLDMDSEDLEGNFVSHHPSSSRVLLSGGGKRINGLM